MPALSREQIVQCREASGKLKGEAKEAVLALCQAAEDELAKGVQARKQIGGCFAPPLPPEKVTDYRALAETASQPIKEAMLALCDMMEMFHAHPPTRHEGEPHWSGLLRKKPLEPHVVEALDPWVPWAGQKAPDGSVTPDECGVLATLFATIDPMQGWAVDPELWGKAAVSAGYDPRIGLEGGPETTEEASRKVYRAFRLLGGVAMSLRNAAHHLLWYAVELTQDRQPLTADLLSK